MGAEGGPLKVEFAPFLQHEQTSTSDRERSHREIRRGETHRPTEFLIDFPSASFTASPVPFRPFQNTFTS